MDTTTSGKGADDAQPEQTEAVAEQDDQAQAMDDQATSQADDQPAAALDTESGTKEAQADSDDIEVWAKKKGLPLDDPKKLATMYRDAERKMHEATQRKPLPVEPPEEFPITGDETYDELIARQNRLEMTQYVRDWFDANPNAKEKRLELQQIAAQRPWLQNMEDVYAHLLANPQREAELKKAGGREALTNLAHKQQTIPPSANAVNAGEFSSDKITPENVEDLVANNSSEWYEANREEILKASGLAR